ncbi:MAG: tripartite tricarboxylate transporter permease [Candidatus Wallbacteria bacterium]|nr:tripartite tricarboxylate transporter permease [Candidatus Wallbacteria bacterium]
MISILLHLLMIVLGTLISSVLACIPALHIYNVASVVVVFIATIYAKFPFIQEDPMYLMSFMLALVVGYSIVNTIPSVFLGAPDEASVFMVMPGQKFLMLGKGYDAVLISAIGGLGAAAFLLFIFPLAPTFVPLLRNVIMPHLGWLLALVMAYMILSEFPKGGDIVAGPWARFFDAWKSIGSGMLAMFLAGILGMIMVYRPFVNVEMSFQNLMPAFVGLFAIPWVLQNILSNTSIPKQYISRSIDLDADLISRGTGSGALGGGFAAIFPLVTGGIGGLMAGHATAQHDERIFMLSQGVSKFIYYVGSFFLFFLPNNDITRGGMSWMLSTIYTPKGYYEYYLAIAAILISSALAFYLTLLYTKWVIALIQKVPYQKISMATLFFLIFLVFAFTGLKGLLITYAATGIGLIPVVFNSRRSNLMGVLLIPITLNMLGIGPAVAKWMGLV